VNGCIKRGKGLGFRGILKILNRVKFRNDGGVQVIGGIGIGRGVRGKIVGSRIEVNGVIVVSGIIRGNIIGNG
ncbi:hypothetical protein, partial [Staphylococcus pasteuri]|uniref:hypothetical protein n=1 Tax=Staphylococcus pasteuri TaxID=45972 RepID=UPI001649EEA0